MAEREIKWLDRDGPTQGRAAITEMKKRKFLEAFAELGNRREACKKAGIGKTTPSIWARKDQQFLEEWETARKMATHVLEEEAHRRAVEGWEEPVFYKGEQVGTVRKYSDTLLIFLLKGLKPETYREKYEVTKQETQPQEVIHTHQLREMSDEELRVLEKIAGKGKAQEKSAESELH